MGRTIALACAAAALAAPAAAQAHLTLQPDEQPAGGSARVDVRVPNERDDASTTKVEVRFPPGLADAATEPVPGWTAKVTKRRLATPITTDDGDRITEVVDAVTWTVGGKQGAIKPGQFQDFGLSLALPDTPGTSLTFKALQTYTGGEVVRWTGPPDAQQPAPGSSSPPSRPTSTAPPASVRWPPTGDARRRDPDVDDPRSGVLRASRL